MEKEIYDTIVVGSGPAGLTAAIYSVRAAVKTIVLAGNQPGGQLTITTYVDNYPGFPNGIGGVKLMMDMQAQVKNLGVTIQNETVLKISKGTNPSKSPFDKGDFEITLQSGKALRTKSVIVATGAQAKWLNIPGEKELIGRGVSGCATCDGMFFRDKVVVVVGGGNTACEEAIFLTKFASKVYVVHRRDSFRASLAEQKRLFDNPKIEVMWWSEVKAITGKDNLEKILVVNNQTQEIKEIEAQGLFVAIGRTPATGFVEGLVELKEGGQIKTKVSVEYETMSTVEGIFAAGDCVDEVYRQAIVAAGDGAKAAIDVEKWLGNQR